jgi:23S rRNA pseudouridine1911/1915/1917 synthase
MPVCSQSMDDREHAARYIVSPALAGRRLDHYLQRMIPKLSRNRIQRAIRERVELSWEAPVKASTPVIEGGVVVVRDPAVAEVPIDYRPAVLFEDADLLAVDKPAGLVVHPTHSHYRNTLIKLLWEARGDDRSLTLAHRLDAETSGAILLTRNKESARAVQTAFQQGEIEKEYLAVVRGVPDEAEGAIDLPLGPFSRDDFIYRQDPQGQDPKPCETRWRLERAGRERSLLRLRIGTGRRHQIRAHLAAIGHPVVGDKLYGLDDRGYRRFLRLGGLDEELRALLGAERHLLHSARLTLAHPRYGQPLTIEAPMPGDLAEALEQ